MLLEAALNGRRSRADHPDIPITPAELAAAALEAGETGAHAVHFHVRGPDGRESLAAEDVDPAVRAIRRLDGALPFGVSTGAWIIRDHVERLAAVRRWSVLPDFASVNFDEEGATDLARHLLDRGMGVEAGVANALAAEVLVRSGLADRCLRIMLEPREADVPGALASVAAAEAVLDSAGTTCPRMLHGADDTAWPLLDLAGERRYQTRIGFEDVLTLPGGMVASRNGDLLRAARDRLARVGWAPA